ncbi:MAG: hypothetical protein IJN34_05075 [Clostridia bacterium]|nr:hypothetical protein [Clostridia bacterium]
MKKWIALLLISSLLFSSCSKQKKANYDNPTSLSDSIAQEGISAGKDAGRTLKTQVEIYKDRVYFQFNDTEKLYYMSANEGKNAVCILEKGKMLGLYGSILYAHNDTHYLAKNLDTGADWVVLQPRTQQYYGLPVFGGEKLYFFGHIANEDTQFVDVIHIPTMQSKRVFIDMEINSAFLEENMLYYSRMGTKSDRAINYFCQADLTQKEEKILCEIPINSKLHKAGERVLIYGHSGNPLIYDTTTKKLKEATTFMHGANQISLIGDVAVGTCQYEIGRLWIYDIASGEEQTKEAIGLKEERYSLLENGVVNHQSPWNSSENQLQFFIEGKTYHADLSNYEGSKRLTAIKGNEYCGVVMAEEQIFIIDWATERISTYKNN